MFVAYINIDLILCNFVSPLHTFIINRIYFCCCCSSVALPWSSFLHWLFPCARRPLPFRCSSSIFRLLLSSSTLSLSLSLHSPHHTSSLSRSLPCSDRIDRLSHISQSNRQDMTTVFDNVVPVTICRAEWNSRNGLTSSLSTYNPCGRDCHVEPARLN